MSGGNILLLCLCCTLRQTVDDVNMELLKENPFLSELSMYALFAIFNISAFTFKMATAPCLS